MAYIFPLNPVDGQLYPVPAVPGSLQYQWSSAQQCWLIYSPLGVQSVTGIFPIEVTNPVDDVVINIAEATINSRGTMSSEDKEKLDNIPADAAPGTVKQINTGPGLTGGPITESGTIDLEPATTTTEGGVIIGDNIDVDGNGVISIPVARFGVTSINVGPGLVGSPSPIINTGTISAALATRLTVGSVRVGSGVAVAPDGTISVDGSLSHVGVLAWCNVNVEYNSFPPQFTIKEAYNVSSIVWAGTQDAPRVRINFQNTLVNADYGFAFGAVSRQFGTGSVARYQKNQNITCGFKAAAWVELELVTFSTDDWAAGTGSFVWNDWSASPIIPGPSSALSQFDIAIIDSQNF